jgi:pimeloyl-ACP methyl ester carboxylesterase
MSAGPAFVPSSGGVRVAVHDLGGPDDPSAPVLLFSHATGFHGLVWGPVAASLNQRYRCLALDYRGHGLSETPAGVRLDWSGMGDDVQAVLGSDLVAGFGPVHGIGHSMGGAALVLAAARPSSGEAGSVSRRGEIRVRNAKDLAFLQRTDREEKNVRPPASDVRSGRPSPLASLWLYEPVIVGPGVLPSSDAPNPLADGAARRRASFASCEEAIANFAAKPPLNQLRPDVLEAYVRGGFKPEESGGVTLRCTPATEAAVFRWAGDSGAWDALPTLELPVAIVAGRIQGDGPVAALARPAFERLAHGALIEHPLLGHFGPLEDPEGAARDIAAWVETNG